MNIAQIESEITFGTNTTTADFLPADRLIKVNNALDEIHIDILQAADGMDFDDKNYTSDFPESTTDLVLDQADYSNPTDLLKEKRLTISYDGTNWYKATPFDISQSGVALKDSYFSKQSPYYDLHDNSITVYPTPDANVIDGLKIWMSRNMGLFTAGDVSTGTKEPGFDRQFHKLIPLKVIWDWNFYKVKDYGEADRIMQQIQILSDKLKQHYSDKQQDDTMSLNATEVNYDTGSANVNGRRRNN